MVTGRGPDKPSGPGHGSSEAGFWVEVGSKVHSKMAELKDAPTEKMARMCPLRLFTAAITALEDKLREDTKEVETALQSMTAAYDMVDDLH